MLKIAVCKNKVLALQKIVEEVKLSLTVATLLTRQSSRSNSKITKTLLL
jgi:hypothetical protein